MQNFSFHIAGGANNFEELRSVLERILGNASDIASTITSAGTAADPTDAPKATPAPEKAVDPVEAFDIRYGVNVYESSRQAFALGKKLYTNADDAEARRTQNGSWLTSFTLELSSTGRVKDSAEFDEDADPRYFAVMRTWDGFELGSNSYETPADVRSQYPDAVNVIGVAVDGAEVFVRNA